MISLALFLAVAALVWMLAAWRAPLWLWTVLVGLGVGVCSLLGSHTPAALVVTWSAFLAVALVLNAPVLRRRLVSGPILKIFRKLLPPMSDTEREALEAGSVWWEAELFRGNPRWQKLLDIPAPQLSETEQEFLDGPVEELCRMLDDWDITHVRRDLPPAVWRFLKEKGFSG